MYRFLRSYGAAILGAALLLAALRPSAAQADSRPPFLLVKAGGAKVHRWPGGPVSGSVPAVTQLGTPTWAWAVSTTPTGSWGRIVLPGLPNNRTGWIRLAGHQARRTTWWVRATLGTHRLMLLNGNTMVATFPIGVGAPDSPTPTGRFNVTDLVNTGDPSGPFGWYAFGLSGHQQNLPPGWSGGTQLAIHGTNNPASIGANQSAGCLHLTAHALAVLKAHLVPGTPVVIRAVPAPPPHRKRRHHHPARQPTQAPPAPVSVAAAPAGQDRPGAPATPGPARVAIESGGPGIPAAGGLTPTPPAAGSADPSGAAASAAARSGRQRSPPP
jgi:hypothetical protein